MWTQGEPMEIHGDPWRPHEDPWRSHGDPMWTQGDPRESPWRSHGDPMETPCGHGQLWELQPYESHVEREVAAPLPPLLRQLTGQGCSIPARKGCTECIFASAWPRCDTGSGTAARAAAKHTTAVCWSRARLSGGAASAGCTVTGAPPTSHCALPSSTGLIAAEIILRGCGAGHRV